MAHLQDEACIQRTYLLKGTMKILKKIRYCSINKTKDIPIKSISVPFHNEMSRRQICIEIK
jgi:hypothetical protein